MTENDDRIGSTTGGPQDCPGGPPSHLDLDVTSPATASGTALDWGRQPAGSQFVTKAELTWMLMVSPIELTRLVDSARALPHTERIAPQLDAVAHALPTSAAQRGADALTPPAVAQTSAPASPSVQHVAEGTAPMLHRVALASTPWPEVTHVAHAFKPVLPSLFPVAEQARQLAELPPALPVITHATPPIETIEVFRRRNYLQLLSLTKAMTPLPDAIVGLFSDWWRLARQVGPDQLLAIHAYAAALDVREVILRERDSRPAVIEFGRKWLNFKNMPESRVEATVAALLDDDWIAEPFGPDFGHEMRTRVNRQHAVHRAIMERQISGHQVISLYEPVGWNAETPVTMLDLTAGPDTVEPLVVGRLGGWDDRRIERVLTRLDDRERAVAEVFAQGGPNVTWTSAAERLGMDTAYGTRVQRKLQREGKKLAERLAAQKDGDDRG